MEDIAQKGSLGEISALAIQQRLAQTTSRAIPTWGEVSGPATSESETLSGGLTVADKMKMINILLENGIEDLTELSQILSILGSMGDAIPADLLHEIQLGVHDFIQETVGETTNLKDLMLFLEAVKKITTKFLADETANFSADQMGALFNAPGQAMANETGDTGSAKTMVGGNPGPLDPKLVDDALDGRLGAIVGLTKALDDMPKFGEGRVFHGSTQKSELDTLSSAMDTAGMGLTVSSSSQESSDSGSQSDQREKKSAMRSALSLGRQAGAAGIDVYSSKVLDMIEALLEPEVGGSVSEIHQKLSQ
jgi:hypothetical protein